MLKHNTIISCIIQFLVENMLKCNTNVYFGTVHIILWNQFFTNFKHPPLVINYTVVILIVKIKCSAIICKPLPPLVHYVICEQSLCNFTLYSL